MGHQFASPGIVIKGRELGSWRNWLNEALLCHSYQLGDIGQGSCPGHLGLLLIVLSRGRCDGYRVVSRKGLAEQLTCPCPGLPAAEEPPDGVTERGWGSDSSVNCHLPSPSPHKPGSAKTGQPPKASTGTQSHQVPQDATSLSLSVPRGSGPWALLGESLSREPAWAMSGAGVEAGVWEEQTPWAGASQGGVQPPP